MRFRFDKRGTLGTRSSWLALVYFGPGAGYIGGRTLFLAYNSGSLHWCKVYRGGILPYMRRVWEYIRVGRVELGFARNANVVPWISH